MLREHDERAKLIAEQALEPLGDIAREVEIPSSDAQRIDLWLRRRFSPPDLPRFLRLISELFPEDSMIEAFSTAIRLVAFYETHRKQYDWRRHLDQKLREQAPPGTEAPALRPPWLWILSAGRPDSLFAEYQLGPRPGFPGGIYDFGPGWRISLLVINELPRGPETLLLRLMGSPAVQRAALAELRQMPAEDPDAKGLRRIVATLRHTFKYATNITDAEKDEFMTAARAAFEQYEQRLEEHIEQRVRKETLRETIQQICAAFQLPLTAEQGQKLAQSDVPALKQLLDHLLATRSWPAA